MPALQITHIILNKQQSDNNHNIPARNNHKKHEFRPIYLESTHVYLFEHANVQIATVFFNFFSLLKFCNYIRVSVEVIQKCMQYFGIIFSTPSEIYS